MLISLSVENNSNYDITYSYDSNSQSAEEILKNYTDGNGQACMVNGKIVKCGLLYNDLPAGGKAIETISLNLSEADITVDSVEKIEYPVEIQDTKTIEDIVSFVMTIGGEDS